MNCCSVIRKLMVKRVVTIYRPIWSHYHPIHHLTCVQQLDLPVWVHAGISAVFVATLPPIHALDVVHVFAALDVKHCTLTPVVKSF